MKKTKHEISRFELRGFEHKFVIAQSAEDQKTLYGCYKANDDEFCFIIEGKTFGYETELLSKAIELYNDL